jgi:hypothetical protein
VSDRDCAIASGASLACDVQNMVPTSHASMRSPPQATPWRPSSRLAFTVIHTHCIPATSLPQTPPHQTTSPDRLNDPDHAATPCTVQLHSAHMCAPTTQAAVNTYAAPRWA